MSRILPARRILALRSTLPDQACLDLLELWLRFGDGAGFLSTAEQRQAWGCSQPRISRRICGLKAAGLIDATAGAGGYHIHSVLIP